MTEASVEILYHVLYIINASAAVAAPVNAASSKEKKKVYNRFKKKNHFTELLMSSTVLTEKHSSLSIPM